jgi:general secretion pathway protein K
LRPRPRGAALLVAMVLLTVVATLAAGMVWQQYRAVQVEIAERSRTQSAWILRGALDWARLILREHRSSYFSLLDAWAQPLEEARLSTFLAADGDNNVDSGPEAFLSGRILDAQRRYNLMNLLSPEGKPVEAEKKVLDRLCVAAGLSSSTAGHIVDQLAVAAAGTDAAAPLMPARFEDLAWLGLDAATLRALRDWLTVLPKAPGVATKVNANTAPVEVLAAVIENIDVGAADRLVQTRKRQPFKTIDDLRNALPEGPARDKVAERVDVKSDYFEVYGRLRLEDRVLEAQSLVQRRGPGDVATIRTEKVSSVLSDASR